jgi:TonB family protein
MRWIRNIHGQAFVFALSLVGAMAAPGAKADEPHEVLASNAALIEGVVPLVAPQPDYHYPSIAGDAYPHIAITQHHEGTVVVLATLDAKGGVIEAKVYQSSGYRELDRAAMTTVHAKQFQRCPSAGQSRDTCTVMMSVVFHLPQP